MLASPLLIHDKSRMRKRACTDLCGGRLAMVVPTATCGFLPELNSGRTTLDRTISVFVFRTLLAPILLPFVEPLDAVALLLF